MTAQSQSSGVVAAATNFVWTPYYSTIVVTNSVASSVTTNPEIFVRTDGTQAATTTVNGAVVGVAGTQAVSANTTAVFTNQLPLPQAEGSNVLGLLNDPLHATQVSVIGSSAGPMEVTVTPQ